MPTSSAKRRYRFSGHVLSPARRTLVRDGRELPLMPRCFDLLVLLVERRNEAAVERCEILDTVWSDVVVTDGALSQAVRSLRRTLGDDPRRADLHTHGATARLPFCLRPTSSRNRTRDRRNPRGPPHRSPMRTPVNRRQLVSQTTCGPSRRNRTRTPPSTRPLRRCCSTPMATTPTSTTSGGGRPRRPCTSWARRKRSDRTRPQRGTHRSPRLPARHAVGRPGCGTGSAVRTSGLA